MSDRQVAEIAEFFTGRAAGIDRGELDVRDGLRFLAECGVLSPPDFRSSWDVIAVVSSACLASGLSLWSHTMVVECLAASSTPGLQGVVDRLRRGELVGSSAMAPAIQSMAGLGEIGTRFRRDGDALIVDGHIRWASNLFDDGFVAVFPARSDDGERVIVAASADNPGLHPGRPLDLLALGATWSSDLTLREARIEPDWIISTDFVPYMRTMKPRLLLLQSAFGVGLARAALDSAATRLDRTVEHFRTAHADLTARLRSIEDHNRDLIATFGPLPELVRHRLDAAILAHEAVGLELRTSGGRGYLAESGVARRIREVAFLPVQAPTEAQLWLELES